MRLSHEKIDYIATALLLFCVVLLVSMAVQGILRYLLQIDYSDFVLVGASVLLALLFVQKAAVNALSRFLHRVFGFDI